jgi:hypothetical protein
MYKDRCIEDSIGIKVQLLDVEYLRRPLKKSLIGSASPRSTNLANIGISSRFFSTGYRSPAAVRHRPILTVETRNNLRSVTVRTYTFFTTG